MAGREKIESSPVFIPLTGSDGLGKRWRRSDRTMQRWADAGHVPVLKFGRQQLVPWNWVVSEEARQLGKHAPGDSAPTEALK